MKQELQALQIQAATHASLQKEIELSQQNAAELEARKQHEIERQKGEHMNDDRKALMSKYGYENEGGDADGGDDGESGKPMTNRDHAAAMNLQNAKAARAVKQQTKQEARQETAKAKADKEAKKEARRQKAGKRERHR